MQSQSLNLARSVFDFVPLRDRSILKFPLTRCPCGQRRERLDAGMLGEISATALTSDAPITRATTGLPTTFVPGRNLIFLTLAAAVAYRRDLTILVGGMCETDFSGYPDCRDSTVKSMQVSLSLGMDRAFTIETPLMWLDKKAIWQLAEDLGGQDLVEIVRVETHTCYLGDRRQVASWGYGCGECPACELRAKGYARWREASP